jgi:hypothetical protein
MSNPHSRVPPERASQGWLTRRQVAARLGLSVYKVREKQKQGLLPAIREGEVFLFDPKAVEALEAQPRADPMPTGSSNDGVTGVFSDTDARCFGKFEMGYLISDTAKELGLPGAQVLAAFDRWKAMSLWAAGGAARPDESAATRRHTLRAASRRERQAAIKRADKDDAEWRAREDRRWSAFEKDLNEKWGRTPGTRPK